MSKSLMYLFAALALPLAGVLAGCAQSGDSGSQPGPGQPTAAEHSHEHDSHAGHEHGSDAGHEHATASTASQYEDQLAKLAPEDRALAEKQKTCPVSGEPLGSMGVPYKVTVQGRDVLLCCQGCEGAIKKNPEDYLAKLPE
jgi:hypothetical protein